MASLRTLVRYAANLVAIERGQVAWMSAPRGDAASVSAEDGGEWEWLAVFDEDDRREVVREIADELIAAARGETLGESLDRKVIHPGGWMGHPEDKSCASSA
jgi:hypothetical protein